MVEAIVHVGIGKTGTNSIQAALRPAPRSWRRRGCGIWACDRS